jgi:acyl carrier protein
LSIVNLNFAALAAILPTIDGMPIVSSRTPEGSPGRCPVCGHEVLVEVSQPLGDAPCPHCGTLLRLLRADGQTHVIDVRRLRRFLAEQLGVDESQLGDDNAALRELGIDSLEMVELVLELEELEDEDHLDAGR